MSEKIIRRVSNYVNWFALKTTQKFAAASPGTPSISWWIT